MNTYLLWFVVLYLVGTMGIGVYAGTRIKNTADFAVAGRSLPALAWQESAGDLSDVPLDCGCEPAPAPAGGCECALWVQSVLARLIGEGLIPCAAQRALRAEIDARFERANRLARAGKQRLCEHVLLSCCEYWK